MIDMSQSAVVLPQASMGKTSSGELLQGTLPLIILRILNAGPNHGFAIARRIELISKDVIRAEEGSLYPALHRMELEGWIDAEWGVTEKNRKAKYYKLTPRGRKQLKNETARWNAISEAMTLILQEA
jgi:PadR family transcriptional regulator PadR